MTNEEKEKNFLLCEAAGMREMWHDREPVQLKPEFDLAEEYKCGMHHVCHPVTWVDSHVTLMGQNVTVD